VDNGRICLVKLAHPAVVAPHEETVVMRPDRLLERLQRGQYTNVAFKDLTHLVEHLGFELRRVRGSHEIYKHPGINEKLVLQASSGQAKPYQARQLLALVEQYDLRLEG
jgi:predicted RNA binding protein YcfA (HicA-like mRNA interferase family)